MKRQEVVLQLKGLITPIMIVEKVEEKIGEGWFVDWSAWNESRKEKTRTICDDPLEREFIIPVYSFENEEEENP